MKVLEDYAKFYNHGEDVRALSLEGKFNQEKALVGALSVILKLCVIFENLCVKL